MFTIKDWKLTPKKNSISFNYYCDQYGEFQEKIIFPKNIILKNFEEDKKLHRLLDITAAYLGISYYKLSATDNIIFNQNLTAAAQKSVESLYTKGLGEFYVRNNLPYPPSIQFDYNNDIPLIEVERSESLTRDIQSLKVTLAFGGGKDSHVSLHILEKQNIQTELVSVVLADRVKHILQKLSHKPNIFIERKIDPKLIKLGKEGVGYNGHVPITAINSVILAIYTYLVGNNWIIFSNERGASVETLMHQGHAVNHQYSKSLEFEGLLRKTLGEIFDLHIDYFSLLRPLSELWIAQYLCINALESHSFFSSCNKNFIFEGDGKLEEGQHWCGVCSKCVYTAIITAPHLSKESFIKIFGKNILNNPQNIQTARDLCGIGNSKPWECVGDFQDTASALYNICVSKEWQDDSVPLSLKTSLEEKYSKGFLEERLQKEIKSRRDHYIPDILLSHLE